MRRIAPRIALLLTLCLTSCFVLAGGAGMRPALAQEVTPDELGDVMLSAADLPGFVMAGDVSPEPRPTSTSDQRLRFFFDTGADGEADILTEALLAPNENDVCLPYRPQQIASGDVLSLLNGEQPNFQLLGSLGVGDVDVAASWNQLDAGSNTWESVLGEVFMRGRMRVYLTFVRHSGAPIDPQQVVGYAQAQDAKLLAAAASADTGVGRLAAEPVPPQPDTPPALCS